MRSFVLRDKKHNGVKVGTLTYDTEDKTFGMTVERGIPVEDLPLSLEILVHRGEYEIGHEGSLRWVRSRITPPNRQNIQEILRTLNLSEYDEFGILEYTKAVSYNDDLYMEEARDELHP